MEEPMNSGAAKREHCWHLHVSPIATPVVQMPPREKRICCHCGVINEGVYGRYPYHGPHVPRNHFDHIDWEDAPPCVERRAA